LTGILFLSSLCSSQEAQTGKPIQFTDVTAQSGIKFVHFKGNAGVSINREEFGPGLCVADFDGDGWQDIYFVNGRDLYNRGISVRNALYRNNGDGTFTDVTDKANVPGTGYGLGCVWGDYDNDGFPVSTSRSSGATFFTTTTGMAPSLTSPTKPVSRAWSSARCSMQARLSSTMTATASWICMWVGTWRWVRMRSVIATWAG
jgi:hypothetical protein